VLANPKWQKWALLLNLVGTIILFYSFQATSSDFRLVTAPSRAGGPHPPAQMTAGPGRVPGSEASRADKQYALCVNNYTLLSSDAASGIRFAYSGCPNWENARPAAVVSIEHPTFVGIGFTLLVLGFGLQYFAVPKPATIAYLRAELKRAKQQEKLDQLKSTR
jgi:hypothetical protein